MEKKAVERVPVVERFSLLRSRQLFQNKATAAANASTKLSTIHSLTSLPLIMFLSYMFLSHMFLSYMFLPFPQRRSPNTFKSRCAHIIRTVFLEAGRSIIGTSFQKSTYRKTSNSAIRTVRNDAPKRSKYLQQNRNNLLCTRLSLEAYHRSVQLPVPANS